MREQGPAAAESGASKAPSPSGEGVGGGASPSRALSPSDSGAGFSQRRGEEERRGGEGVFGRRSSADPSKDSSGGIAAGRLQNGEE